MLSIFSIPKPFRGHIDIIQRNAIESWLRLEPKCEIVLCGNDFGVADIAAEYDICHLQNIAVNAFGTPLLDSAFGAVRSHASSELLCYVNCDIVLLSDLIKAIGNIDFSRYLMVGERCNLEISEPIDFSNIDWEQQLRDRAKREGKMHGPWGIDYFVFPAHMEIDLPPFAVGRPGWDNWMLYYVSFKLRAPVIDTTSVNLVVHQNHDHSHVPQGEDNSWWGPEAHQNFSLYMSGIQQFTLADATHTSTPTGLLLNQKPFQIMKKRLLVALALNPLTRAFLFTTAFLRKLKSYLKRFL